MILLLYHMNKCSYVYTIMCRMIRDKGEQTMNREGNIEQDFDKERDVCSCSVIHEDAVIKARDGMPKEALLYDLAEVFKVFGDLTRIRILCALIETELCVCDISALLDMTQSSISHQLRVLKQAKLVKYRKEGKVDPCERIKSRTKDV